MSLLNDECRGFETRYEIWRPIIEQMDCVCNKSEGKTNNPSSLTSSSLPSFLSPLPPVPFILFFSFVLRLFLSASSSGPSSSYLSLRFPPRSLVIISSATSCSCNSFFTSSSSSSSSPPASLPSSSSTWILLLLLFSSYLLFLLLFFTFFLFLLLLLSLFPLF